MTRRLYEIKEDYLAAFENLEIDPETGELLTVEQIEALAGEFNEKAEAVACHIKDLEAFAASLSAEEAELKKRRATVERKAAWLREYLTGCFDTVPQDSLETPKVKVSFRSAVSVTVTDPDKIPEDYFTVKTTKSPNKTAIKTAIKNGVAVEGAELTTTQHIQIK